MRDVLIRAVKGRNRVLWRALLVTMLAVGVALPAAGVAPVAAQDIGSRNDLRSYRVEPVATREARSRVGSTGAGIYEQGPDYVLVRATTSMAARLIGMGYAVQEVQLPEDFPPADSGFHNYAEMVADIQTVEAAHANLVDAFTIGKSYQNRDIWAVKVSDRVGTDEAEPEVMFDVLHHAREHLTTEMGLFILHLLADNYSSDAQIKGLVDSREVWIVFNVNPDGGEFDINPPYQFQRKNLQPNPGPCEGTDLNRNYGYRWAHDNVGSSGDPCSEVYRGSAAFSAPETQRVRDFVASRVIDGVQQIRTHISYHTYSELVLWPYGYTFNDLPGDMDPDDWDVFVTMGEAMADTTCQDPWGCYTPQQSSDLYLTNGTTTDWMYGANRIFSFTFEMFPKGGCGFYCEDEDIVPQTERNREAVLYLVGNADCAYETAGLGSQYCPTISSFSPRRGRPGTVVTISGSGFSGAVGVAFNGTPASFTVDSNSQITATVPAGASTGFITVEKARGFGTSATKFKIRP
jgi:hypothetical protein